jgi:S1-C subfamily serine protease
MKVLASAVFTLLLTSAALGQDDERIKRIVDRIEKEIRESHDRTREEIRAIIRAEIQKAGGKTPAPAPKTAPAPSSKKAVLGITADDMTDAERKTLGISGGIKIGAVRGPALDAGLKIGDVLVKFDGEAVTEDRIGDLLSKHQPGEVVHVEVLRGTKPMKFMLKLGERKD